MSGDELPCDRESKPCTPRGTGARLIGAVEAIEYVRQVVAGMVQT